MLSAVVKLNRINFEQNHFVKWKYEEEQGQQLYEKQLIQNLTKNGQ